MLLLPEDDTAFQATVLSLLDIPNTSGLQRKRQYALGQVLPLRPHPSLGVVFGQYGVHLVDGKPSVLTAHAGAFIGRVIRQCNLGTGKTRIDLRSVLLTSVERYSTLVGTSDGAAASIGKTLVKRTPTRTGATVINDPRASGKSF